MPFVEINVNAAAAGWRGTPPRFSAKRLRKTRAEAIYSCGGRSSGISLRLHFPHGEFNLNAKRLEGGATPLPFPARHRPPGPRRRPTAHADRCVLFDRLLHSVWSKSGWMASRSGPSLQVLRPQRIPPPPHPVYSDSNGTDGNVQIFLS